MLSETLHLALFQVDVLDGDDTAGDFAVDVEDGRSCEADPRPGSVVKIAEVLSGADGLSIHDDGAKDVFCTGITQDDALVGIEDHAVGFGGSWDLRSEFDGMTVVVFAFDQGLFDQFAPGDIDEREGHADDFIDFVASGLKGDEEGACDVRVMRIGASGLEFAERFAVEGVQEIWLPLGELLGTEDVGDVAAEVGRDGNVVYFGEAFVDADVAKIAIEEAEADGHPVIDGVELGEALGGKRFEA